MIVLPRAHVLCLQRIVICVQVVGRETKTREALQWPEIVGIESVGVDSSIPGGQHGSNGNQVDVTAGAGGSVEHVLGLISDISDLNKSRPWYALRDGETVAVCQGLAIVGAIDRAER